MLIRMNKEEVNELFKAYLEGDIETINKYVSNPENLKQLIKEYLTPEIIVELGLDKYAITALIKATGDVQEYLFDWQNKEDETLVFNIGNVIKAKCGDIESYLTTERVLRFGLDQYAITGLIKAIGIPKKYLFDWQDKENGVLVFSIGNVIKAEGGNIESYLTPENIEKFHLRINNIIDLIIATGHVERYLTLEKIRELNLYKAVIPFLIKKTGDIEKYLTPEKMAEFGLNEEDISSLVKETGNAEKYKFKWQTNLVFNMANLIKATGDIDSYLTPEKVVAFNLNNIDITRLVKATVNPEKYLFDWQDKEDKALRLNIANVIKGTGDIEGYLTPEKIAELGLDLSDIVNLIRATGNIESYLTPKKIEELGLSEGDVAYLKLLAGFKIEDSDFEDDKKKIKLPKNMTIGVEIESEGPCSTQIKKYGVIKDWKCEDDRSLTYGVEMISPILTGDTDKSSLSIKKICYILGKFKQVVSDKCGGHIHIGSDYLTTSEAWMNLIEIWGNAEEIFYIISNRAGKIPRDSILKYASPISGNFLQMLNSGTIQLDSIEAMRNFAKRSQQESRYFGINFQNLGNAKNTIEFRLADGTLDANTWIENINLFGGLIVAAERLSGIEAKPEKERTEEEKIMLRCFQKIKDNEAMQGEKAEALIELVIPEEDRGIYLTRYQVNSKLIEENPEIKVELEDKIARRPITIKELGKSIFTGENPVNGVDYAETSVIIERNLQREEANNLQID